METGDDFTLIIIHWFLGISVIFCFILSVFICCDDKKKKSTEPKSTEEEKRKNKIEVQKSGSMVKTEEKSAQDQKQAKSRVSPSLSEYFSANEYRTMTTDHEKSKSLQSPKLSMMKKSGMDMKTAKGKDQSKSTSKKSAIDMNTAKDQSMQDAVTVAASVKSIATKRSLMSSRSVKLVSARQPTNSTSESKSSMPTTTKPMLSADSAGGKLSSAGTLSLPSLDIALAAAEPKKSGGSLGGGLNSAISDERKKSASFNSVKTTPK